MVGRRRTLGGMTCSPRGERNAREGGAISTYCGCQKTFDGKPYRSALIWRLLRRYLGEIIVRFPPFPFG